jgi:hypothetical protein
MATAAGNPVPARVLQVEARSIPSSFLGMRRPACGKPACGKPVCGKPAYGKPVCGKPAYGKPAYGKPAYGKKECVRIEMSRHG